MTVGILTLSAVNCKSNATTKHLKAVIEGIAIDDAGNRQVQTANTNKENPQARIANGGLFFILSKGMFA